MARWLSPVAPPSPGPAEGLALHAPTAALPRSEPRPAARVEPGSVALSFFRVLMLTPFVLMAPEIVAGLRHEPHALAHLSASTADVLGTSSFLLLVMMLTVTPVHTMTGWTWHLPLRRDYGVAMFLTAALDLTLAAATTGNTFPGGVLVRIGGHSFLAVGTIGVLLTVPIALTASKQSHRWLGSYWKRLHKLVYVVWAVVLLHLLLLFGFRGFFLDALVVSIPLAFLRLPRVHRWWNASRRTHRHRIVRFLLALVLVGTFARGVAPLFHELAVKGSQAFVQQPKDD